ncbi:unnamed protein product [Prunus brigantina]
MDECASRQFERSPAGRARVSRQREGQQCDQHADIRSAAHSQRTNFDQQATGNPSQAQSTNTPFRQDNLEIRPLRATEEVN